MKILALPSFSVMPLRPFLKVRKHFLPPKIMLHVSIAKANLILDTP